MVTYPPRMEQDDASFRALADPSRRVLLDRLYERDGQALGELQTALPQMSRIAVMKHLRILEAAGLVVSHRSGRRRLHYLNPVPIRRIHDRWLDKFRARAADVLLTLQAFMEEPTMGSDSIDRPSHISQIYIRATPAEVWRAITESEFTLQYYYGSTIESEWRAGATYRYAIAGNDAILGVIVEADPPRRLVQTFDARWDDDVARDAPSRLTWEIEEVTPGVSKVTTIHDEFPSRTATFEQVAGGMTFILSGLKSVLETGRPMEAAAATASA
jgi:uncharacterized protein YndB with AHSA1/START domain/DNA-binding transcriptional ArsR family regulator